ncbi:MAG: hypothetical protein IKU01_04845 [Bacteroidales bacterium]|nr:hypothetical protein [Bacteroidales bacterium]
MKKLLILVCCVTLLSCGRKNCPKDTSLAENIVVADAMDAAPADVIEENANRETLNDIRFDGWTKKEWADNEYIRAVRKYIDAYNNGKIENTDLYEHKKYIQGKFVIADIQPYLAGGALIYIVFYDYPEKTFSAYVYSDVDVTSRVVSNYECRGLKNENIDLGFSQEDILQFLKECQEHKLW